jgi:polyisoprenoid-binding protein YceI
MNKQQTFIFFFWLLSFFPVCVNAQNRPVNTSASITRWKGTKLAGTGKHEGTLTLKSGYLTFKEDKLTGGKFIADMNSIRITDIPPDDYIPIRNLTNHLESDFETKKYPEAVFQITETTYPGQNKIRVNGSLTIRSVTKKIDFTVTEINKGHYTTTIRLNRADWSIGEKGSWLEKKLVDPEIELQISVKL